MLLVQWWVLMPQEKARGMDGVEDSDDNCRRAEEAQNHLDDESGGMPLYGTTKTFLLLFFVTEYWVCWCRKNVLRC